VTPQCTQGARQGWAYHAVALATLQCVGWGWGRQEVGGCGRWCNLVCEPPFGGVHFFARAAQAGIFITAAAAAHDWGNEPSRGPGYKGADPPGWAAELKLEGCSVGAFTLDTHQSRWTVPGPLRLESAAG
jgi:hypothetical protein